MRDDHEDDDGSPDWVLKRGSRSRGRSRRRTVRFIAVGAVVAALIGGGVAWAAQAANDRNPTWPELVPELAHPSAGTHPTFDMPHGDGSLDMPTFRKLGEDSYASYWVAQDRKDQLCLFASVLESGFTASACTDRPNFMRSGIGLGASFVGGGHIHAYLAPDGYVAQDVPAGLKSFTPTFVAGSTDSSRTNFMFEATGDEEPAHMVMTL